ncbi:MAG: collagen-like protein, partial [Bacteroidota bacterium]
MKKIIALLSFVTVLFISCEGEPGPPGADGLLGQVFEVEIDFTAADNYQVLVEFPSTIQVFSSDVVVAYILDEIDNGI